MKDTVNVENLIKYLMGYAQRMNEIYKNAKLEMADFESFIKVLAMKFCTNVEEPQLDLQLSSNARIESLPLLPVTERSNDDITITFTQKELMSMPKQFREYFTHDGRRHKMRRRQTGKNSYSYNIRYRRDGYDIDVSSTNPEEAKQKFIAALQATAKPAKAKEVPSEFDAFGEYFFQNYYIERVAKETHYNMHSLFGRRIQPHFGNMPIGKITPAHCKDLLEQIKAKGQGKTADDVHSILNQIFKYAIAFGKITQNPLTVVPHKQHKRKNGVRLTLDEESKLLSECRPNYRLFFALYLYCGIRPSEIYTVRFEGDFVVCQNIKQNEQVYKEKKIPIIKKLRPYLQDLATMPHVPKQEYVRNEFNRILSEHTLKDCRRTFASHCDECGVNPDVRECFLGHAPQRALDRAYIEYSDEYLLQEGTKIDY